MEKKRWGFENVWFQNHGKKALKLAWIKRIQDDSQASWKIIPNYIMHKHGIFAFLTKCNFATNTLARGNLAIFYEKILNYWSAFKNSTGDDFKSRHKDEILWNKKNILIAKKKTVFYKHWFDAGISKIDNLLNGQNGFLNWQEFLSKFNLYPSLSTKA